ncbi:MAG: hypothetical protein US95_C0059G0005 [Candidatus Woesebacteria bacterium GW2011_GWB1_38_5]|uniref:Uncharacterized protein n=4 Tax=Candidatus Woeseibacteriota TaxID=1752722 RepID=A0A0G0KUK1_9BACT|nr:MAG: hypothetical protein US67_C0014G0014 [Candidatus Woesebacteria bacterium GW2011_GWD1_38_10]KKQ55199.1 MAG: hypothetical protein US75_C0029G0012 [Candidatus Woesebacteria bacterium GW2011_GWC1_38_13]KKQ73036.1 MAG: hypothetical protein US95_C0059G0005 [Candidatus Woesebacteria bacterium GW2011_GWB1_38_5]KKQ83363.1 MAG: hypothetical protein UT06_C0023G0027 [Candidatus Woesebacteria bacterium GW2011_GWA1_38_8]
MFNLESGVIIVANKEIKDGLAYWNEYMGINDLKKDEPKEEINIGTLLVVKGKVANRTVLEEVVYDGHGVA